MQRRLFVLPCSLLVLSLAIGCGGGGGGGNSSPVVVQPTATATPTVAAVAGFVPATGAVTTLSGTTGALGSTVSATNNAVFIVESGTQPAESQNTTFTTYPVTVTGANGANGAALTRRAQSMERNAFGAERLVWEHSQADFAATTERLRHAQTRVVGRTTERTRAHRSVVSDQRDFKIIATSIGNSGGTCAYQSDPNYVCFATIHTTLQAQSTHANVWVDNAIPIATEFPTSGDFQTAANDFEGYYTAETGLFGPATTTQNVEFGPQCATAGGSTDPNSAVVVDTTGADPHVNIVITDILGALGEGGYFFGGNMIAQNALNCGSGPHYPSNESVMFVMGGNSYTTGPDLPANNEQYWLNTDMPRTMSHEFQHLEHFVNKVLEQVVKGTSQNGTYDDAFIDEGCSMFAEDYAANGIKIDTPRYSYSFMLEPSNFSLSAFTGYQPNPVSTASAPPYAYYTNTAGSYGQAYLFMRYLYDRFGSAGIGRIYASTDAGVGPVVAAANGEPFAQLTSDFATAVALQGTNVTTDPRYSFSSSIVLRGPTTVTSRRTSKPTRTLIFGGPQPPETFAGAVPNGFVTLGPGSSATVNILDGGALYFPIAGAANGPTSYVARGALPTFQGVMAQGALPTPTPGSL